MPEPNHQQDRFSHLPGVPLHFWAVSHAYEPATAPTTMDEFRRQQGQQVEGGTGHLKAWNKPCLCPASCYGSKRISMPFSGAH